MRWLLTTPMGVNRAQLEGELAGVEVVLAEEPPVALAAEQVFSAEGPEDLPARLEGRVTCILAVYPDSDPEPYRG